MLQKKQNPVAGDDRVAGNFKALGGAFDDTKLNGNLIDLQAFRLLARFQISVPLARAVAEHAYANRRAR